MRLYLVRHGEAKSAEEDPARSLTDRGRRDVEKVAAFLRPLGLCVSAVWHSGKARAIQTAEILAAALAPPAPLLRREGLAPTDPVEPVAEEIAGLFGDLMIVGHMPFVGRLASLLVIGRDVPEVAAFRAGGALCLEGGGQEPWRVGWMIVPDILP